MTWSRQSLPSPKRWKQISHLQHFREPSRSKLMILTGTINLRTRKSSWPVRLKARPKHTRTCKMISLGSRMKTVKKWLSWNDKRMRLKLRRTCTSNILNGSFKVLNLVKTVSTRRKRRNCKRRLNSYATCSRQRRKSTMRLRFIWRSVSLSSNNSTKIRRRRKMPKLLESRRKGTKLRRERRVRTKKSSRSWSRSKWTRKSARSAKRSKTRTRPRRSPKSGRRCPWRTPPGTSRDAGFGSRQRANSSPRRARRAAKARKRRRSDGLLISQTTCTCCLIVAALIQAENTNF